MERELLLQPFLQFFDQFPTSIGILIILSIYVVLVIGQALLQRQITIRNTTIQHGFFRHLRNETYESLLHANWNFFIKNRKSDLLNILTAQIATASAGTHSFLQFISSLSLYRHPNWNCFLDFTEYNHFCID